MIQKIKLKPMTILFNIIAILILIGSTTLFNLFNQTKQEIQTTIINSQIQYIDNITDNIADTISKSVSGKLYKTLKYNKEKRETLEDSLKILITDRYRYVYIVDKEKKSNREFRFLLDGAKDKKEKSEFAEPYTPLNIDAWNSLYKTKKATYFKHNRMKNIWITYLKPIIVDNKVSAIIVVDFSLQTSKEILSTLNELNSFSEFALPFSIFLFFGIILFSYIDGRREKVKVALHSQLISTNKHLQEKTKELKEKTLKISQFNATLTHKVEEEVAKNREKDKQMLQQSRLAQMGEMMSMIAHQWRQPLAAISATSLGINLKAQLNQLDNETAMELTEKISDYSQHLSSTIDDFREFFKPNKEKKETTYNEMIQSVLSIVETSIKNKNIELIKVLNSTNSFHTYPNELKQVILNLLKNAEDIFLDNGVENPQITIQTDDNILTISDNGGGISENIIEKIFDPYFSTKKEKNGTGLGLYMSKTIVEEHCGGKISVSNGENGAIFSVELKEEKIENLLF